MRAVETGHGDYPWGEFFTHLQEYAQEGEVENAQKMIRDNLHLEPKQLLDEPRTLSLDQNVVFGLNHMLGLAYFRAEGYEQAYTYLKHAWDILSQAAKRDTGVNRKRLEQQKAVLNILTILVLHVDPMQHVQYLEELLRVEELLLNAQGAAAVQQAVINARESQTIYFGNEAFTFDSLPAELQGLTLKIIEAIKQYVENHPDERSNKGALSYSVVTMGDIGIMVSVESMTFKKVVAVGRSGWVAGAWHIDLKGASEEVDFFQIEKGINLEEVLHLLQNKL